MFSKADRLCETTPPPVSQPPAKKSPAKSYVPSIISADLRIHGNLVCSGDVQIDGWVSGDVQSQSITVGEGATVNGILAAESVRICGQLIGEVRADTVILQRSAHVTGNIYHRSLAIESGAFLEGLCKPADTYPLPIGAAISAPIVQTAKKREVA